MRINIFCFLMITFLFSCKNESKDNIDFTVKETKKNKSQLKIETPQLFETQQPNARQHYDEWFLVLIPINQKGHH